MPPDATATRENETTETIEPTAIIQPSSQRARSRADARDYTDGADDVKGDLPESETDSDSSDAGDGDTGQGEEKPNRSIGRAVRRVTAGVDQWVADLTLDLRPIWRKRLYAPDELLRIAREHAPKNPVARKAYIAFFLLVAIPARVLWAVAAVVLERPSRVLAVAVAGLLLWPTPVGQAVLTAVVAAGEAALSIARTGIL